MIEELRQGNAPEGNLPSEPEVAAVFVMDADGIRPVRIHTGAQTWEYTEIVGGLEEGARVVIPPSASLARQSQEMRERAQRWGGGMMGRR